MKTKKILKQTVKQKREKGRKIFKERSDIASPEEMREDAIWWWTGRLGIAKMLICFISGTCAPGWSLECGVYKELLLATTKKTTP